MAEEKNVSLEKSAKKIKLFCAECGKKLKEEEALVHKNLEGKQMIICHECFEKEVGVDYKTFMLRREAAKQNLFATLFCIIITIYAFIAEGPLYGFAGIVITILIFLFAAKVH